MKPSRRKEVIKGKVQEKNKEGREGETLKKKTIIKYEDVLSDEYGKLQETETEEESPLFNIELESKEVMRANWKNEMERHTEIKIPRILTKHFKKIRSGLDNLMEQRAALFSMSNDTEGKGEEFFQETYNYASFLMSKNI
jgi:hypothetical protein